MSLFVKNIKCGGKVYDFNIEHIFTIKDLKKQIEKKYNIPFNDQKIIYDGKLLDDNILIRENEIYSTIYLI